MWQQIYPWDCGHACLAYTLDLTLHSVLKFMPRQKLTDWQIGWALKIHGKNSRRLEIAVASDLQCLSICNTGDHWVVNEYGKILCPAGSAWKAGDLKNGIIVMTKPQTAEGLENL